MYLQNRVYPRLRGGSLVAEMRARRNNGLSPPTRGIPDALSDAPVGRGSIPAYAGDPRILAIINPQHGVYPRLRGGSHPFCGAREYRRGLSPPTRGIPFFFRAIIASWRSIPAYAGDPAVFRV